MSARLRGVLLGLAVVALVVAARVLPVGEWLRAFQAWTSGKGALGGVLYAIVYTVAALCFVPGSVLTIGAGLLFGLLWGTVVVSVASTAAAALAFLIARYLARARVEALAHRNPRFAAIDAAIREEGWRMVALLRLSPLVPFNVSNYLYGLTPVAFGPYVLASWAAMLPATIVYVWIGAAGQAATAHGERTRSPAQWALLIAGLLASAAVTVMVTRAARRRLASKGVGG